ncbi:transposon Ty3-I Gag-Pol polyprotein [Trichonephila clavipes]|uniref:Transposon Ty3-I Gag-Pol polyprotein n=1 Tax=Trichonephila clavipes TaxID=2585209 RepID=A0A8X6VM91_TRICX|nr:transposon Ty3-I Gag-Pol polyprotein [Trichonephila clavipes]
MASFVRPIRRNTGRGMWRCDIYMNFVPTSREDYRFGVMVSVLASFVRSERKKEELQNEEIVLAHEIVPEIDHFHVPGNLVGITKSFKNELRNAFHHAAIKKTNPARSKCDYLSQPHISRRLFIKDKSSNTAFLIDTGSDVSVLPASLSEKRKGNSIQQLSAANTSPINVYASVSVPIIGADFLYNFNISPDLRNRKLIDNATKISTNCKLVSPEVHSIKLVSGESIFHDVLREFPEIVKPPSFSQEVKHNIKHFIETSGPPVFAKARRLAPDRLKIAKSEFQHMLNLGHVRPSKSNYASPLHIVPKKDSNDLRPVGYTENCNYNPIRLYESTRMQFGLCNAAASTFQRFVDEVLRGLNFVYAFIDDILVASSSEAEHIQHLRLLFSTVGSI